MQGDGFHSGNSVVEMYPHQNRPSSLQSGDQKRAECSEKRDSRWRHIHAPWIAEGKLVIMLFLCFLTLGMNGSMRDLPNNLMNENAFSFKGQRADTPGELW